MNKKILILGNGFIGNNLYKYFLTKNKYDTIITDKTKIDVTNTNNIKNYITRSQLFNDKIYENIFDYIIYAVGLKDIKKCENNKSLAYEINSIGINNIVKYISKNTKIIYISTDYVFDGKLGHYSETSATNPQTFYGKTKLLGEQFCLNHRNSMIVRTSGVYGSGCIWLKNLLDSMSNNQSTVCFADIYNSPTYVMNLAEMIEDMMDIDYTGIINLCGETNNRYELYTTVCKVFNKNCDLLISGNSTGEFPKNISLNNSLYKNLSNKIPDTTYIGLNKFKNEH